MKLRVTKNTQSPNGDFTLTLTGEDGVHGELSLPVPPPEKDVFLYELGQEFELTAGPKAAPVVQPTVVDGKPKGSSLTITPGVKH